MLRQEVFIGACADPLQAMFGHRDGTLHHRGALAVHWTPVVDGKMYFSCRSGEKKWKNVERCSKIIFKFFFDS